LVSVTSSRWSRSTTFTERALPSWISCITFEVSASSKPPPAVRTCPTRSTPNTASTIQKIGPRKNRLKSMYDEGR
jgi:hypothetical protein